MDASNLSSNWKKLQQSLGSKDAVKKDKPASNGIPLANPLKRRPENQAAPSSASSSKRVKVSSFRKSRGGGKMGAYVSSTTRPSTNEPSMQDAVATPEIKAATPSEGDGKAAAGKYIALDCEMVGTSEITPFSVLSHNRDTLPGAPPEYSILARVSLVNYAGATVYDAYVFPPAGVQVSNYRTQWSGITAAHLDPGNTTTRPISFEKAQREVNAIIEGRVLVGHALKNDLDVLGLTHPKRDLRDTSRYSKYRAMAALMGKNGKLGKARTPSLKKLANDVLGLEVQMGKGHSSVEDAWTSMLLFKREKNGFETEVTKLYGRAKSNVAANGALGQASRTKPPTSPEVETEVGADSGESDEDETELIALDEELEDDESELEDPSKMKKPNKKKKKKKKAKSRTKR